MILQPIDFIVYAWLATAVLSAIDPANPLAYGKRSPDVSADEQRNEYELIGRLNSLAARTPIHPKISR